MKRIYLFLCLLILSFSSCGKVEPTADVPSIEQSSEEPTIETSSVPTIQKEILESYPRNIDIKYVNQLPYTIEAFLSNMSLNEEDGLYYYNRIDRKKSFNSMFYGG